MFFEFSESKDFSNMKKVFPFEASREFDESERSLYINLALSTYCLHSMCSKAIRRDVLLQTSYPTDALHLITGEDHLQSLFILDRVKTAFYLMEPLYYYRKTAGSTTSTFRLEDYCDFSCKVLHIRGLIDKWSHLSGSTLNSVELNKYILVGSYRYIQSALRAHSVETFENASRMLVESDLFLAALHSRNAVDSLRFDMRVILSLIASGHTVLSKALLHLCSLISTANSRSR